MKRSSFTNLNLPVLNQVVNATFAIDDRVVIMDCVVKGIFHGSGPERATTVEVFMIADQVRLKCSINQLSPITLQ